ncbi:MAG TPA: response regulator [Cyclobacteriaceae bacterium]|jgi:CheY-like chemotaxis protein|nr:response regulator [Cyclobacteriaceae bacterium]
MMSDSKRLNSVLLIDDDDIVNTLHSIVLRQSGLVENIRSVMSGSEALSVLSACQEDQSWPSIIFVDINMPGMNGWEFIERFYEKFSIEKHRCKVCLLSSSLDPRDKEKADKSELVDFYFSKPLMPEIVKTICKEISVSI